MLRPTTVSNRDKTVSTRNLGPLEEHATSTQAHRTYVLHRHAISSGYCIARVID